LECPRRITKGHDRSRSAAQGDHLFQPQSSGYRSISIHAEAAEADDKVCNIVHLIYRARPYEGIAKDFEFSRRTMEEHWQAGYRNARQTLANPEVLELPNRLEGVRTFDCGEERC
jgi:hypothetical protein